MHIAVDAVGIKHSGGATVLLDLLQAAYREKHISRITIFCSPAEKRRFDLPLAQTVTVREQKRGDRSYLYRILWFQKLLGFQCSKLAPDVLLCMTGAGVAPSPMPQVTFIQQSLPFAAEFAKVATPQERLRMATIKRLIRSSCRSANRVIVQTPTMKNWVADQLGLAKNVVEVVLPSVSPLPNTGGQRPRMLQGECGPKLLYVGSQNRYKNVEVALEALPKLRVAIPETQLYLTWPIEDAAGKRDGVHCLGYLSRERLAQAYREADLLIMPSLIETAGLPILEAMEAGLPVLVADRPYAHDIAEDAALFFDPLSPSELARRAEELLKNAGLSAELIRRGHALVARRTEIDPYQRIVEIVLDATRSSSDSRKA